MTKSSRQVYDDSFCLLQAVTFQLTGTQNLEVQTAILFIRHLENSIIDVVKLQSVTMQAVKDFEVLTELIISIFYIELKTKTYLVCYLIGVIKHKPPKFLLLPDSS